MKILICGEYGVFCKELINRLKKEKHTIFVISGSQKPRFRKPSDGILQEYNFSYRSKSIRTIIENVQADAMIILGACDVKYRWTDIGQESVRYLSGITNLLVCAKEAGIPRIIYCSSMGVYAEAEDRTITEETKFQASSSVLKTYIQIENLCQKQDMQDEVKITKIRFPEVYGDYRSYEYDICATLMDAAYTKQGVHIFPEKEHRILYVKDAVDVLMRVFNSKEPQNSYLVEGTSYTEKEIMDEIQKTIPSLNVNVVQEEKAFVSRPQVKENAKELQSFKEKYPLKDGLKEFYKVFGNTKREDEKQEKRKGAMKEKVIPFLENIALFFIAALISFALRDTWVGQNVNFYLFYMIIISVTYGTAHSLLASLLIFALKAVSLVTSDNVIEYAGFVDVLQILIIGVAVGYMRDRYKRKSANLEDEKKYFQSELVDLTQIYDGNRYIKDVYEKRLMNYENSMAWIYETASKLDFWEPTKVVFQAVDVVCELLGVQDVAIYIAGKREKYLRLMASSTDNARVMGKSVCVDESFFMFNELQERSVYRNKDLDSDFPTYACGTFSDNKLTSIIMVWTKDLSKINLYQSNMFALLCRLIEASMSRARLFWNELAHQYIEGTNVLQEDGFERVLELCIQGKKEGKVIYSLLGISSKDVDMEQAELYQQVGRMVRETDFIGKNKEGLSVILMNVNEGETESVLQRFEKLSIPVKQIRE